MLICLLTATNHFTLYDDYINNIENIDFYISLQETANFTFVKLGVTFYIIR